MSSETQPAEPPVRLSVKDGIAELTLNRPRNGNALDMATAEALLAQVIRCDQDEDIRVVILAGTGKLFCAGGDVPAFVKAGDEMPAFLSQLAGLVHLSVSRLVRMPKPVICKVHGPAAGAGLSLAVCGDFVLASPNASFKSAYAGIGLAADGGCTWLLPRLIGLRKTQDLLMLNEKLTASDALDIGLVSRLVDEDELDTQVQALAKKLADGPQQAFGLVKSLLVESFSNGLETQMEREARAMATASGTSESKEGVSAFLEKRAPNFRS